MTTRREIQKSLRTTFEPGPRWWAKRALLRGKPGDTSTRAGRRSETQPRRCSSSGRRGRALRCCSRSCVSSSGLAHWPGEPHEVWEAYYHPALRGWESNVLDATDVTPEAAAYIRRQFLLITGSRHRLIDKTPRNALRFGFLESLFPDAHYVYPAERWP